MPCKPIMTAEGWSLGSHALKPSGAPSKETKRCASTSKRGPWKPVSGDCRRCTVGRHAAVRVVAKPAKTFRRVVPIRPSATRSARTPYSKLSQCGFYAAAQDRKQFFFEPGIAHKPASIAPGRVRQRDNVRGIVAPSAHGFAERGFGF